MIRSTRIKTLSSVTPKEMTKVKEEIKAKLPNLQPNEIRRYRVPHHEVVVLELHEEGSHEAAEYLKFLFDLDEETREAAGPNTIIWNKPRLKDNKELIDYLRKVLIIFCQQSMAAISKTKALIESAMHIENLTWEWWWIAETLYRSAFWIAREIEEDEKQQTINILRYIYARFLFHQMKNAKAALEYARLAQRESREKPWSASKILGIKQESLFRESCSLLHKILLSIAREARESEADVAVHSCQVALSSACESGHEEILAEAHFELGKSQIAAGDAKEAIKNFYKSLAILERLPHPQGICKAHAELASAYEVIGEDDKVLVHLQKFKDSASKFQLSHELAEAHYLTGEFYLARNNPKEATSNLEFALSVYNALHAKDEANRTRCLIGVSKGQEMMEAYQVLIMQSIVGAPDAILKLCLWKDRGERFI